jgi:hypothetical protein
LRQEIGSPLSPNERPAHDQRVAVTRAALADDTVFAYAWQKGRASTTLEQAIEVALAEQRGQNPA